jgi:hypothetical protein
MAEVKTYVYEINRTPKRRDYTSFKVGQKIAIVLSSDSRALIGNIAEITEVTDKLGTYLKFTMEHDCIYMHGVIEQKPKVRVDGISEFSRHPMVPIEEFLATHSLTINDMPVTKYGRNKEFKSDPSELTRPMAYLESRAKMFEIQVIEIKAWLTEFGWSEGPDANLNKQISKNCSQLTRISKLLDEYNAALVILKRETR